MREQPVVRGEGGWDEAGVRSAVRDVQPVRRLQQGRLRGILVRGGQRIVELDFELITSTSLVSHARFAIDHDVGVGEFTVARRRRSHVKRLVRIRRRFQRQVAKHHETGLAGLWQLSRAWSNDDTIVLDVIRNVLAVAEVEHHRVGSILLAWRWLRLLPGRHQPGQR